MNKKAYIDMYVLRAKQGDKAAYKHLWSIYSFVLTGIYDSVCSFHPTIKYHRVDVFHNFYMFFWDLIMSYRFDDRRSFGRYMKEQMISKTRFMLNDQYDIYEGNVISERILFDFNQKQPVLPYRKRVKRAIKNMTTKQKEFLFLNYFVGVSYDECRKILQITGTSLGYHSRFSRKKMKKALGGSKERVYRVFQTKNYGEKQ